MRIAAAVLPFLAGLGDWDTGRIGAGPPPIRTDAGWLHIYHGVWSVTQTLSLTASRIRKWRRPFAAVVAAIVVLSDGRFNRGEPAEVIGRFAKSRKIPIHAVGIVPFGQSGWEFFGQLGLGTVNRDFPGIGNIDDDAELEVIRAEI